MNSALPSGLEISILLAVAMSTALAGGWLARKLSMALNAFAPTREQSSRKSDKNVRSRKPNAKSYFGTLTLGATASKLLAVPARLKNLIAAYLVRGLNFVQAAIGSEQSSARRALDVSQRRLQKTVAQNAAIVTPRISIEAQIERTVAVVSDAVCSAQIMRSAHNTASEKLDAANYAFEKLMAELEGVMALKPASAEVTAFPYSRVKYGTRSLTGTGRVAA